MAQATTVFGYDLDGIPSRQLDLEKRLDYLDSYCRSANAALGIEPAEERQRSWWRRLLGWLGIR